MGGKEDKICEQVDPIMLLKRVVCHISTLFTTAANDFSLCKLFRIGLLRSPEAKQISIRTVQKDIYAKRTI